MVFTPYLEKQHFDVEALPAGMVISTMSLTFAVDLVFDLDILWNEMVLVTDGDKEGVCSITYNGSQKPVITTQKKVKKSFYNSVAVRIKTHGSIKPIHFKIFRNGSVQAAGCCKLDETNKAISILVENLYRSMGAPLPASPVKNVKINLINATYRLDYAVNREELYNALLEEESVYCVYEKCKHAGVCIKYPIPSFPGKKPLVVCSFVFESGAIVFTGAKDTSHLVDSFDYVVNTILKKQRRRILKLDEDTLLRIAKKSPHFSQYLVPRQNKKKNK